MNLPNKFIRRIALVSAALLMLVPLFVSGQNHPPGGALPSDSNDAIFSAESRLVPLNVTVTDKAGHLVTDLPRTAFQIKENGVAQQIKDFKREDVPVSMGLIIDNSGSMRRKRQAVESAALALVRDSNAQDEVFIVNFNDEAYLDTDFTSDIREMERGLKKIDSRGGTAMRDAIRMSIDHLKRKGKRDKKVVLVVTDGNDNASDVRLETLVRQAQQADVLIYAIGLLNDEGRGEASLAKRALNLLVGSTGGQVFYPKDVSEVQKIAHEVAHNIRNQYSITYTPTNEALDGTFRAIKIAVKGSRGLTARTRTGYFATKDAQSGGSGKKSS